jgi:hypothetical protein
MKKFHFPLDRVLEWRQTQARLEEATLVRLTSELQTLQLRRTALSRSVVQAQSHLLGLRSASPTEIGAWEHFRVSAKAQTANLDRECRALEAKIAQQTLVALVRRREEELLRRLRARRLETWQRTAEREIERQA